MNRAAEVFRRTDGDIREVVRAIVTSNEFYSRSAFRSKVKSPFEVVVSALRAVNAEPDATPRTAQVVAYLGQPIYGHQAPNGYPETGESWMNSGAILNRINFGMALAGNRIPGVRLGRMHGVESLRAAPREPGLLLSVYPDVAEHDRDLIDWVEAGNALLLAAGSLPAPKASPSSSPSPGEPSPSPSPSLRADGMSWTTCSFTDTHTVAGYP